MTMYCPKCGKRNVEGAEFCQACGRRLPRRPEGAPADGPDAERGGTKVIPRGEGDEAPHEERQLPPRPVPVASDLAKGLSVLCVGLALLPFLPQISVGGMDLTGIGIVRVIGAGLSWAPTGTSGVGELSLFLVVYISVWIVMALSAVLNCHEVFSKGRAGGLRATFVVEGVLFGSAIICAMWLESQAGAIGLNLVTATPWTYLGLVASVGGALMVPAASKAAVGTTATPAASVTTRPAASATPVASRGSAGTATTPRGSAGGAVGADRSGAATGGSRADGSANAGEAGLARGGSSVKAERDVGAVRDAVAVREPAPAPSQRICDASTTTLVAELRRRGALTEAEAREVTRRLTGV